MIVLMLGSGPNVVISRDWQRSHFDRIVTINNAWAVRPDWDFLVHPDDFPVARFPSELHPKQRIVTSAEYVPANNAYGGVIYAGGTMAFSAGYWALAALQPRVLAYLGCDMVYSSNKTHFYGNGTADPLRPDPTLQDLRAKSARLELLAARQGCAVVNLSTSETLLSFPRANLDDLACLAPSVLPACITAAPVAAERTLGAFCSSGEYWNDPVLDAQALARIDDLWLEAHKAFTEGKDI
jgi:hypothetical protein